MAAHDEDRDKYGSHLYQANADNVARLIAENTDQPEDVSHSGYDDNQPTDELSESDEALVRTAARRDLAELTRKAIRSGVIRPSDEYSSMQARF